MKAKEKIKRYGLFIVSLWFSALGVAFAKCGDLGVSPLSSVPNVLSLRFTALIPDFELSTHLARSVLPKSVPFADAIFNISRAAVLLKSLEEGNEDLIRTALVDRLHQPYRAPLIPGYEELRARALESGALAFCISGAGPTLLCLSMDEGFDAEMEPKLGALPNNWQLLSLPIDHEGVQIWEE